MALLSLAKTARFLHRSWCATNATSGLQLRRSGSAGHADAAAGIGGTASEGRELPHSSAEFDARIAQNRGAWPATARHSG
jgi:hypothetical protein